MIETRINGIIKFKRQQSALTAYLNFKLKLYTALYVKRMQNWGLEEKKLFMCRESLGCCLLQRDCSTKNFSVSSYSKKVICLIQTSQIFDDDNII